MKRRGGGIETVADAVVALGGAVQAAALARSTPTTVYKWIRAGKVRLATALVPWCEALEPTDLKARWALARRLVGLDG